MVEVSNEVQYAAAVYTDNRIFEAVDYNEKARENFWRVKRGIDIIFGVTSVPVVLLLGVVLFVLNPFCNPGPVFFLQKRMGRYGEPFIALKFRTMVSGRRVERGPDDPLEAMEITPLGHWLRRTRLDEAPQILNVIAGHMSLIGPRPDMWEHAVDYCATVPGYVLRHAVRPGISGHAQVNMGYAEGREMTIKKTKFDLFYIQQACWRLEFQTFWRTFIVMWTGFGAR